MARTSALARLAGPSIYLEQMDRLETRLAASGRLDGLTRDQVSLRALMLDRRATARRLASAIADGSYDFRPGSIAELGGPKRRRIFRFDAADWLVHSAVSAVFTDAFENRLAPSVHSYRVGRSSWEAAAALAGFIRSHRKHAASPEQRGLYAMRADVSAYGDSIPIAATSSLWTALADWLSTEPTGPLWRCVQGCVRPVYTDESGELVCRAVGLPVGSPVANPLTNLYLDPIDRMLDRPSGFYARFGDDLVFAHPDAGVVGAAVGEVERQLGQLGLAINAGKRTLVHLNAAGRPGPSGEQGSSMLTFVGCRIGADGTVGLPAGKVRDVVRDLRARLRRQAPLWKGESTDVRGRAACELVERALDPSNPLAVRHASLLRAAVNDRAQLKQIDYSIAREVIAAVTGDRSPRGFRQLSYKQLRSEFGLVSLVVLRNRVEGE